MLPTFLECVLFFYLLTYLTLLLFIIPIPHDCQVKVATVWALLLLLPRPNKQSAHMLVRV